jgi:hypothetical protein
VFLFFFHVKNFNLFKLIFFGPPPPPPPQLLANSVPGHAVVVISHSFYFFQNQSSRVEIFFLNILETVRKLQLSEQPP